VTKNGISEDAQRHEGNHMVHCFENADAPACRDQSAGAAIQTRRQDTGFTLLEVLITLVILAIGMLGLAGMQVLSIRSNSFGQEMTVASTLAQNKLEELREEDFDTIADSNDTCTNYANGVTFARTWTVADDTPANGMKTVEVVVSWPGATGPREVTVSTIISDT
jgi:type IV pilus assembly protein PilV